MKKYIIVLISLIAAGSVLLATTKSGTSAAQFLKIGSQARTMGMGEATVASPEGLSALHWNPAGLARYNTQSATFSQSDWLVNTKFFNVAGSMSLGRMGTVGAQLTMLDYGEMAVRTELDPEGNGEFFVAQNINLGIAYAYNLTDRFSIGGQMKYIQETIWHMSAATMAFDVGALFTTPFKDIRLGMSIVNFGGKMQLSGRDVRFFNDPAEDMYGNNDQIPANYELDEWAIPLTFRVGLAGEFIDKGFLKWSWTFDALHPSDNTEYINLGTELALWKTLYLRTGFRTLFMDERTGGFTAGLGMKYQFTPSYGIEFDYAFVNYGDLGYINMLTIGINY
ncbi:MAG: PorV/PorQ family protein [Candidatus Marinimicrobia bacterium]|nr:PorV/PorQ family protein [Candidatus Neomarinimicrobiota bacterium]